MAEKRRKIGSFCVLKCASPGGGACDKLATVEVFPATEWEDGLQGQYRIRINRSWHDGGAGARFCDRTAVGRYLASLVGLMEDNAPTSLQRRHVHKLEACWAPCGPIDPELGIQLKNCQARVVSEDSIIGQDGRQYVAVSAPELGGVRLLPLEELNFYGDTHGEL